MLVFMIGISAPLLKVLWTMREESLAPIPALALWSVTLWVSVSIMLSFSSQCLSLPDIIKYIYLLSDFPSGIMSVSLCITDLDLEVRSFRISPRPVCLNVEKKDLKPRVTTSEVRLALLSWCQDQEKEQACSLFCPTWELRALLDVLSPHLSLKSAAVSQSGAGVGTDTNEQEVIFFCPHLPGDSEQCGNLQWKHLYSEEDAGGTEEIAYSFEPLHSPQEGALCTPSGGTVAIRALSQSLLQGTGGVQ